MPAMMIYNLFPPLAGSFTQWRPHMKRASEMGFNWIFVNPVQYTGFSGSLYSIKNYFWLNQRFVDHESPLGPEEQLRGAIKYAADLGMGMMVDLVINHAAIDSDLIKEHPDWFLHEEDGEVSRPFCYEDGKKVVWGDLARFDHESKDLEGLYQYFLKVVLHMIGQGFRAFRCDAAYQVPRTLWSRLIADVKRAHPGTLFLAETLGCLPEETVETALAGFDYVFNSSKWWDMHSEWLPEQYEMTREAAPSVSFPETHDTTRIIEDLAGDVEAVKQRYLFAALFSAGVMAPIGFEYCFKRKLSVVETTPADWESVNAYLTGFIREVNAIKSANPAFHEDAPTRFMDSPDDGALIMIKESSLTGQGALLIFNKSFTEPCKLRLDLGALMDRAVIEDMRDISPTGTQTSPANQLSIELPPSGSKVLVSNAR